ncbi:hypothetical protein HQ531_03000 [bacterium]|nr:hypothetical protein [bacterium]
MITIFLCTAVSAKKKGAPGMSAGAPGDRTCNSKKCHAGNELNSDKAKIFIAGLPKIYTPNEIYEITLRFEQPGAKRWGFQATVANDKGDAIGSLISVKGQETHIQDNARYKSKTNRQYLTHTKKGILGSEKGKSPSWIIQWKAPETVVDTSNFYFAFNAGNGNNKDTGDFIYTRSFRVSPGSK